MLRGEPEALRARARSARRSGLPSAIRVPRTPLPGGAGADGAFFVVAQADGQELVQGPSVLGQDAERPVLRVDEVAGLLADPPEHDRQVQLGIEDEDRLDQSAQLGGIIDPVEGLHGKSG